MVKKSLLIMMLLALFAPWAANAQTTELTVNNGTSTNGCIPVYGNYADKQDYTSEFIIPSADLVTINGMDITKLTFYLSNSASGAWNATFKVYMKEVENTTITSMTGPNTSTVVYTGTLDATNSTMVVNFDDNYTYNGGNLLIGTTIIDIGNWNSATFFGISATYGSSAYASSPTSSDPTKQSFLPKTTFTYEQPSTCKKPTDLVCSAYTATTATLSWTEKGTATNWVLQYSTDNTFATGVQSVNVSNTPSKQLTGLTAETTYYARVRPDCDENLWSTVREFKPSTVQIVTIGSGANTEYYLPTHTYYNYSYYYT